VSDFFRGRIAGDEKSESPAGGRLDKTKAAEGAEYRQSFEILRGICFAVRGRELSHIVRKAGGFVHKREDFVHLGRDCVRDLAAGRQRM
jgi:hypothetical protein